jgi:hypothetical protein
MMEDDELVKRLDDKLRAAGMAEEDIAKVTAHAEKVRKARLTMIDKVTAEKGPAFGFFAEQAGLTYAAVAAVAQAVTMPSLNEQQRQGMETIATTVTRIVSKMLDHAERFLEISDEDAQEAHDMAQAVTDVIVKASQKQTDEFTESKQ